MRLADAVFMASNANNSRERSVPPGQSKVAHKIDAMMEQASESLVQRRYFECEKLASEALRRAIAIMDYGRIARIVLPLQESRRQIRDLAVDTGNIVRVDGDAPTGSAIKPGMYVLSPPRVGVDGRALREAAMQQHVPIVVLVREPATRAGLWPIVAVGPVTVRARIEPPASGKATTAKTTAKGKKPRGSAAESKAKGSATGKSGKEPALSAEWILQAGEALGDAAIADLPPELVPQARVMALAERLEAVPDHEKLHQRLEEAAREAARLPVKRGSPAQRAAAAQAELEA